MIDWNDKTKRKAFREALQEVYFSIAELRIFVDEELGEKLELIADGGDNLRVICSNLIQWAQARPDRIDALYQAFKAENPDHSTIQQIEQRSLVTRPSHLNQTDWANLFEQFLPDDIADLQRAFRLSFRCVFGVDVQRVQPQYTSPIELTQFRELLESYDADKNGPAFAVRFVEYAIEEFQRSNQDDSRDFGTLKAWVDRIAQQFGVPTKVNKPARSESCHAYLLIALEESGADVIAYPELHIIGEEKPIGFGATPITRPITEVADQLSLWIRQAEDVLIDATCDDSEVTLEIFLPCQYLEEDIATTWLLRDKRNNEIEFGIHRRFVVRSSDRIRDRQVQKALRQSWKQLEACVEPGSANSKFHRQLDCLGKEGMLLDFIKDQGSTGLKLLASLPTDRDRRKNLLYEVIDAPIPIALWTSDDDVDVPVLEEQFDHLLNGSLTNFDELARRWRSGRNSSSVSKHIRILCDRPDRLPRLPDGGDEDAIVA